MKRIGGLWDRLVGFDNLLLAYHRARLGKRKRADVAWFSLSLESELLGLQAELQNNVYRPGAYRQFMVYERKPRVISAAPFRDRVVHHAIMNLIEGPLDRRFIDDCYACRKGKGVHAAVDRYQHYARRYAYALKLDVRRYFPSIDHLILKGSLRHRIKDLRLLNLLDVIIDHSPASDAPLEYFPGDDLFTPLERQCGIPIGNLTSQFFANLYLDDLDHWVKEELQVPAYLRYVDDLILLDDDKNRLWAWRNAIAQRMNDLRLRLHSGKAQVYRAADWLDVLGYVVKPYRRRLRNENGHRFHRRLRGMAKAYARGRLDLRRVGASVNAWIGHAKHADTESLRKAILGEVKFTRESA